MTEKSSHCERSVAISTPWPLQARMSWQSPFLKEGIVIASGNLMSYVLVKGTQLITTLNIKCGYVLS